MVQKSKHFELQSLARGVYAALATDGGAAISNSGILDLGGQTVVFDTFLTPQAALDLRRAAEELTGRAPQVVVNSHYHNDHIWGNQVFVPEAQIIASARTRQLITTAGKEQLEWYAANSAGQLATFQSRFQNTEDAEQRSQLAMWVGYYAGLVEAIPHLSVCLPGITFAGELEMHGSDRSARLIEFEGAHTGSDTALYLPQDGIVFMSDLLFVGCHPYLGDGDPWKLLQALKELSRLDAVTFVPGHGPVGSRRDLALLIEYVEGCLETAQTLVGEGEPSDERIGGLQVAEKYREWKLARFYPTNIRFLCQRLQEAK